MNGGSITITAGDGGAQMPATYREVVRVSYWEYAVIVVELLWEQNPRSRYEFTIKLLGRDVHLPAGATTVYPSADAALQAGKLLLFSHLKELSEMSFNDLGTDLTTCSIVGKLLDMPSKP